jgi:ABC-type uncharacterized transport system involved in gliding motility auxiliary subunit
MGIDRRTLAVIGIALAIVCFFALNTYGSLDLRRLRLDLTQNEQFTLAPSTRRMLGAIEEPVTLRLYVSQAVRAANPFLASYADRVHDKLKAFADAANGQVTVEYVDPEPFSPEEDRAVGFGLEPIPLDNQGMAGYLGLAGTNSTDDVDVLPILSPEREAFLDYDLTRLVYNLAHPEKPVVAMLSGLPLSGDPASQYEPWQVMQELGQFFDIRQLGGDIARIDDDVRILMLVQPQELSDKTLYAIDQFVLRGGRALVFVDPHSEALAMRQQQPGGPANTASDLPRLFERWGIELVPDKVVGDRRLARQVSYPSGNREQIIDYLPWLSLDDQALGAGEVVTAELDRLNLGTVGILKAREGSTTTFTPILQSTPQAMAIDADRVRLYPDPFAILRDYKPGNEPLVMAARVSGPVTSAFEAKPEGAEGEQLKEAKEPVQVMVVADTDLLDDRTWLATQSMLGQRMQVPVADNANFVANALDFLAGSDALIDLRGREVTFRPFTKVAEIRREAEAHYRAKEQELVKKLEDLQGKLSAARVSQGEDAALLSEQQRNEIEGFRSELLATRAELREVQHALRQDLEALQSRIRFVSIAAVPILVALIACIVALVRRARYRRRVDAALA